MRWAMTFAVALGSLMLGVVSAISQTAEPAVGVREIQMTAKRYEFNPNELTVKKGERVKLVITALDHDHGFKLEAFGIGQKLRKSVPTSIEFTPDRAGTFRFQCSNYCGLGHGRMKGTLIVEEAEQP